MNKVVYTMKKYFRISKTFLVLAFLFSIYTASFSQPPPPPPPPSIGHGASGNQPGGGAPIGEGMFFLFGLAGLYGGKKLYDLRKTLKAKEL
jgi:hypothetical protein